MPGFAVCPANVIKFGVWAKESRLIFKLLENTKASALPPTSFNTSRLGLGDKLIWDERGWSPLTDPLRHLFMSPLPLSTQLKLAKTMGFCEILPLPEVARKETLAQGATKCKLFHSALGEPRMSG